MPENSGTTVLDDLPESIIVWEILVRLPSKEALRCRAICKSWHRATSTRDFLSPTTRHQPSLPIIKQFPDGGATNNEHHLAVFHGDGACAGNQKLLPVLRNPTARRESAALDLHSSLDGLLVVSNTTRRLSFANSERVFYVRNPATRQCATLPQLVEHGHQVYMTSIAGLYLHHPSGEYRVLYFCWAGPQYRDADFYITSIGSDQPKRFIGRPPPSLPPSVEQAFLLKGLPYSSNIAPVLHRGGLHWDLGRYEWHYTVVHDIIVFDTMVETLRWLCRPGQVPLGLMTSLLEMDGSLSLFSSRNGIVTDVFVMQDYENEVWELRYRIDLSGKTMELPQFELTMAVVNEHELLIRLPRGRLLHCDIDGKVLGIVEWHGEEDIQLNTHLLRESIVPLALFETQRGTRASNLSYSPLFFRH